MFICMNCKNIFSEPKHYHGEQLEYFGSPCREIWDGCPKCSEVYCKAYKCSECGEYITDDYIKTESGDRICYNCYLIYNIGDES